MKTKLLAIAAVVGVSAILVTTKLTMRHVQAQGLPGQSRSSDSVVPRAVFQPNPYTDARRATTTADHDDAVASPRLNVLQVDRNDPRFPALQKLNDLRKKLQAEQSDEDKGELTPLLRSAIAEYFDRDMDHRRAELARLQKRAEDTETVLSRRVSAKEELVDLQLQAIVNDAEGLGLFGDLTIPLSARQSTREYVLPDGIRVRAPVHSPITYNGRTFDPSSLPSVGPLPKAGDAPVNESLRQLQDAYHKLAEASAAQEESAAKNELRTALSEYFDADMQHRHQSLDEVRKGLDEMASRLAKREEAKEEIVDLQAKLFINETESLGFFATPAMSESAAPAVPASLLREDDSTKRATKTAEEFIKAFKAEDLEATVKLSKVPFLMQHKAINSQERLRQEFAELFEDKKLGGIEWKMVARGTLAEVKDKLDEPQHHGQLHNIVSAEDRVVLIEVRYGEKNEKRDLMAFAVAVRSENVHVIGFVD